MKRLIAGMGISGVETARFLKGRGEAFDTYDDRKDRDRIAVEIGDGGYRHFRETPDLRTYSEIVISPGIALSHPLVDRAKASGVAIVSEIEFAHRFASGVLIAVTGSNGKSTTASLIHHVLIEAGRDAVLCGNIGVPFIARVDDRPGKIYVLEVSSFQMEHAPTFRPHGGVLLNISPDHLDRHGSMEAYIDAKLHMFANQQSGDRAWVHPEYLGRVPGNGHKLSVPGPDVTLADGFFRVSPAFELAADVLSVPGKHNRTNALFVCAVSEWLGISAQDTARAFSTFQGLENRMERVGETEGRVWINDSKATNTHATQAAIDSMTGTYVLILGGSGKGQGFDGLRFSVHPPKAVVAYGQAAPDIAKDLAGISVIQKPRFEDACLHAHELAGPDATVLLAPACASYDQFDDFVHRGRVFKVLFQKIKVNTSCP